MADGHTTKKSARCTNILPGGAVRIKWPEDVEFDEDESFVWSILKPGNFNKNVHLGWRLDAKELMKREEARVEAEARAPKRQKKRD